MTTNVEQIEPAPRKRGWGERISQSAFWGVVACGTGLFSDGYLNASIGPANTMLKRIYDTADSKPYAGSSKIVNVAAIAFAGTVFGQLVFGFTSDHWSRTGSLMVSTVILIIFAILTAGAYGGGSLNGLITAIIVYRFFVGIGIGGEYPAGSVGAAEHSGGLKSGTRNRWFIMFTNVMIDFGFVVSNLVAMIIVLATTERHLRAAWRILLGLGAIPPLALFYLRMKISEPEPYTHEKLHFKDTPWSLILRFYWFRLLLVSVIWFIYDFCAYSFGNFSTVVLDNLFGGSSSGQSLWRIFGWGTLLNFFYMPGCLSGAFLADSRLGPKWTLILGTALQAIVGFGMAGGAETLFQPKNVAGFVIVYGLFLAFGEMGPGDQIGLFASKTSATAIRGKYYGIAAAFGKIGAFVGNYGFTAIGKMAGDNAVKSVQYQFWLGGSLALFSCLVALFLPSISQDVVAEEDIRFREFLVKHGFDTGVMGTGAPPPPTHPTLEEEHSVSEKTGATEQKYGVANSK